MSPFQIAQWFVNNPGLWYAFVEEMGNKLNNKELQRLANDIQDFVQNYPDDSFLDVENDVDALADAEALASAGWGTDEDYGGGVDYL